MAKMDFSFAWKLTLILCSCVCLMSTAVPAATAKKHVLVISLTKGFRHGAIPLGEDIINNLGEKSGAWQTDFARTDVDVAQKTSAASLKRYDLVVFNNTTGDLPIPDRQAFLDWVKAGGAVAGIHAATDTFHGWPEYLDMMGGEFIGHGPQAEVEFLIQDPKHSAAKKLPKSFKATEEIYLFKNCSRDKVRVLIALDKHPNTGDPGDYPISWVRAYGKGRVFYTALGHREDLLQSDVVQEHLLGGIRWALGLAKGDANPLPPPPPVSPAEEKEGFRALFNGKDLTGWTHRFEKRTLWTVQNGMLVMGNGGSGLVNDENFDDFIIRYEYMVPKGGNSGLYLRGVYEIQILDDFDTKKPDIHSNGAIYGKITPSQLASRPAGEWQTVEAKLVGNRVTVILNGVKIIDDQRIVGLTGGALDGMTGGPGPIFLQGDHGPVAFRNIRIKVLR